MRGERWRGQLHPRRTGSTEAPRPAPAAAGAVVSALPRASPGPAGYMGAHGPPHPARRASPPFPSSPSRPRRRASTSRRSTAYLQGLRSAQGRFTQTNPDRSTQTGSFYLQKPGRIRFEYDKPKGAMVIADGKWVGVFDPKSNRNPTRYPLDKHAALAAPARPAQPHRARPGPGRDTRRRGHRHHRGRSQGAEGGPHGDELRRRPGPAPPVGRSPPRPARAPASR